MRVAVSLAHSVVLRRLRIRIATPNPTMIHQPGWVALANPLPITPDSPLPATAPTTATPSVAPTWRLVEATAAATPA